MDLIVTERHLARTFNDALAAYCRENAITKTELDDLAILEWFFDTGKMSGLHNATKHLGPHIKSPPRKSRKERA